MPSALTLHEVSSAMRVRGPEARLEEILRSAPDELR